MTDKTDYIKIGKELSDACLETIIEEAISDGKLRQCERCEAWDYETEMSTKLAGDEAYTLCQHCE